MTNPLAHIHLAETAGVVSTVFIVGEIDATNVDLIATQLYQIFDRTAAVRIDLTAVTYLDSRGVCLIQALVEQKTRGEIDLALVIDPPDTIYRLLAITGLDKHTIRTLGERRDRGSPL